MVGCVNTSLIIDYIRCNETIVTHSTPTNCCICCLWAQTNNAGVKRGFSVVLNGHSLLSLKSKAIFVSIYTINDYGRCGGRRT